MKISTSETATMTISRSLGLLHLLELAAPFGAVGGLGSGSRTFAWASATVLARSRPRTLNLTAISRLPCSR